MRKAKRTRRSAETFSFYVCGKKLKLKKIDDTNRGSLKARGEGKCRQRIKKTWNFIYESHVSYLSSLGFEMRRRRGTFGRFFPHWEMTTIIFRDFSRFF